MHESNNQTAFQKKPARTSLEGMPRCRTRTSDDQRGERGRHGHEKKNRHHEITVNATAYLSYKFQRRVARFESGNPLDRSTRGLRGVLTTPRRAALSRRSPSREMAGWPG